MNEAKIFNDAAANLDFHKYGFVKLDGRIDESTLRELQDLNERLQIPDYFGCGYNCGMNTDQEPLRRSMHNGIGAVVQPYLDQFLNEYDHYTSTFVNKEQVEGCFVHAHQDYSYTNEDLQPSFMCFIPLTDVDLNNAALGMIPYSHRFYDYVRAFPFPLAKTAVSENEIRLMSYFRVISMKAGEMLFFNQKTIHGSFSNYSDKVRNALSFSIIKRHETPKLFVHNPSTQGRTVLEFEVDQDNIVRYNNPALMEMFRKGSIDLPYELIREFEYEKNDCSWESIAEKLSRHEIYPNEKYSALVDQYLAFKKKHERKSLLRRVLDKTIGH